MLILRGSSVHVKLGRGPSSPLVNINKSFLKLLILEVGKKAVFSNCFCCKQFEKIGFKAYQFFLFLIKTRGPFSADLTHPPT